MRAAEELRSAAIFRELARLAEGTGMPDPWPRRFVHAMHDELRHARLCATVGTRLGAAHPHYDMGPVHERLAPVSDAWGRLASLLLVEVAIGETISMCLFRAGRRAAVEPLARAALGSILADETRHQRLGWTALASLWPMLDEARRSALHADVADGLAGCERHIAVPAMRCLEGGTEFDPAHGALGVLDPSVRLETFYFAVERLVIPRLTRLGLDGPAAWENRYRRQAPRCASSARTPST